MPDNPLKPGTGPNTVALLGLLSNRNSFSQDRDIEFQPGVCDTQSAVHRGHQQRDERKVPFPGGQRKYKFTEDFQRHELDEVDGFKPVKERPLSPVRGIKKKVLKYMMVTKPNYSIFHLSLVTSAKISPISSQ